MACRAIQRWTLSSLVGAYIDLALAYLLLCGAALAFIATNFLSLFGLSLPCPCDGLFGLPQTSCPHQRFLVDHPSAKIASIQLSLRTRFPFDSICSPPNPYRYGVSLLEIGAADESCASVSTAHNLSLPGPPPPDDGTGTGSGSGSARPPVLRRRRRRGKSSPTAFRISPEQPVMSEESSQLTDSGQVFCHRGVDDRMCLVQGAASARCGASEEDALLPDARLTLGPDGSEAAVIIRDLERAIEEEQAARAALYLELEKERSAAATAADEAMAMIQRLQEEKAAIQMEARQYHRMIEEKYAYDEEEMEILKEIVVRREMENHFLEKEVEEYRQKMLYGGKDEIPLEDDQQLIGHQPGSVSGSSEDPMFMLHRIYESLVIKETTDSKKQSLDDNGNLASGKQDCAAGGFVDEPLSLGFAEDAVTWGHGDIKQAHSFEKHPLDVTDSGYESNLEFQEKGMLKMEVNSYSVQSQMTSNGENSFVHEFNKFQGQGFPKETSVVLSEEDGARENNTDVRPRSQDLYRESGRDANQFGDSSQPEAESRILDVYAVDDRVNLGDGGNKKEINASGIYGNSGPAVETPGTSMICPSYSNPGGFVEQNIMRSCSDMTGGTLLMDNLCDKSSAFGLKRRSMSAVDNERFKLEVEVELLRKRLKVIQQGREKLSFTMDHSEKESFQLQLLEEIARQLQEVRKRTERGKSARQASLPLTSSKGSSKKRRCRSVSRGVHDST